MREWNSLKDYPQPPHRIVRNPTIEHRIVASRRGREFFDGDRAYGYGGYQDDGRWEPVAECMRNEYALTEGSSILQINCEKGFLLNEFLKKGMEVRGIESSAYARRRCPLGITVNNKWDFKEPFDLVIAVGAVYVENLPQAVNLLIEIERISFSSFITLASYDSEDDLKLFKQWSLLATTILKKDEWREVMRYAGYTGDYWFVNAETLRLRE